MTERKGYKMNRAGKVVKTTAERKVVEMELGEAFAVFKAAFRDSKEYDDDALLVATYLVSHAETLNSVTKNELQNALKYVLKTAGVTGNCGD